MAGKEAARMKQRLSVNLISGMLLLLGTAALCCLIRPAADDFYYMTFCDGGLGQYIANTIDHYRTLTGRVFVHFILCPLLQLDMWPFRIFNLLLICALGCVCVRLCSDDGRPSAAGCVLFLCLFWLMGNKALSDGALWGAGSLNYLFPAALIVLYAFLFRKYLCRAGEGRWLFILAFFSAATVEMTGILTVFVICYFCLADWGQARARRGFALSNLAAAALGYASLFTSPGVAARLEQNSFGSISLLERINANFALFDRKICGPEGLWVLVLLTLLSAALLLFRRGNRTLCALSLLSSAMVCLTGLGVIYDGVALALVSIAAFLVLCAYGVWAHLAGERVIPLFMLCLAASLGVCMVSPVVGARMVLPGAVFLIVICMRGLFAAALPQKWLSAAACALSVPALILLVFYGVMFSENAAVIDENSARAGSCAADGVLELSYVPDEAYGATTVPSAQNFGSYYLAHMGIPGAEIVCIDPGSAQICYNGRELGRSALLRGGQYYVPVRTAADVLGAGVSWELASAVVTYGGAAYCFHSGDRAANTSHGICRSVKLLDRVRTIDGSVYISQRDFEALFSVSLSIA